MKYVVDLAAGTVSGPSMDAGNIRDAPSQTLIDVFSKLSDQAQFSTGLLPVNGSGLLMYQRGMGYEQMAYQYAPGVTKLKWGTYEASRDQQIYEVATPWRIIVIDYAGGEFVGIRAFYAAHPISAMNQQLYACNTPNINTRGYGSGYGKTSLGWICCYHNIPMKKDSTLAERVEYGMYRYDGLGEPYNDANMSETDGTRVYSEMGYPTYMWDRTEWSKKTAKEGVAWCLNPDTMMPLYVQKEDEIAIKGAALIRYGAKDIAAEMAQKNYVPYTFASATEGPYRAYYSDEMQRKPFRWEDLNLMNVSEAWMKANSTLVEPTRRQAKPVSLKDLLNKKVSFPDNIKLYLKDGVVCPRCSEHYISPEKMDEFDVVIVQYEINNDGDFHILTNQEWCLSCQRDEAVWMDDYSSFVSGHLLVWCGSTNSWAFPYDAESCLQCESYFPRAVAASNIVYDEWLVAVGCTVCVGDDEYKKAYDDHVLYQLVDMVEVPIINYVIPTGGTFPIPYQDVGWVSKQSPSKVCACGLICKDFDPSIEVAGQENKACASCVNSLGEFVPMFKVTV